MIHGEYESLCEIQAVRSSLVPTPLAQGEYHESAQQSGETTIAFLLTTFRHIGQQPPPTDVADSSALFAFQLANMHKSSVSPTGKFGFHTTTCHATLAQPTAAWDSSWSQFFARQLRQMVIYDRSKNGPWPEFHAICNLIVEKVVPRLLEPLQSEGRYLKPCLVHGDLWDENTAVDAETGDPFIFDACSFYAHNEYEIGNWRAKRHRLSGRGYVEGYKSFYPASEPGGFDFLLFGGASIDKADRFLKSF